MMWNLVDYSFVKNKNFQNHISKRGWHKADLVSSNQLNDLRILFDENHEINQVGMFYSMYSKDLSYRKKVRDGILTILAPLLNAEFEDYKVAYAIFVVKTPGEETEFFLHQDPSIVDEHKYSSLHLWIPLEKITEKNGPLCLIEGTHLASQPYRGITVPSFFKGNEGLLREYLKPIYLDEGEAILLDPRVVHNSLANLSDKTRVAALVGIIPEDSEIILSHCEAGSEENVVEQHLFSDDYFLNGQGFYLNCECRPENGKMLNSKKWDIKPLSEEEILKKFDALGISRTNQISVNHNLSECVMFGEPKS